jgi:hypothetical protein
MTMSAAAAGGDKFRGTARKVAKLSIANAQTETFSSNSRSAEKELKTVDLANRVSALEPPQ